MIEKPIRVERHKPDGTTWVYETRPDPLRKALKDMWWTFTRLAILIIMCRLVFWLASIVNP